MTETKKCPVCRYQFDLNLPGVDTREQPFFTFRRDAETLYICSRDCMEQFLDRYDKARLALKNPRGPDYGHTEQ